MHHADVGKSVRWTCLVQKVKFVLSAKIYHILRHLTITCDLYDTNGDNDIAFHIHRGGQEDHHAIELGIRQYPKVLCPYWTRVLLASINGTLQSRRLLQLQSLKLLDFKMTFEIKQH